MKQATRRFEIQTRGKGLYEFTNQVELWVGEQSIASGLLTLFIRHTSASLIIQENADPDVQADLETFLARLVPEDASLYRVRPASVILPDGESWVAATEKARQADAGVPIAWVPFV